MAIFLGIIGFLIGLIQGDAGSALFGAALGFLLGAHIHTQQRLQRLEKALAQVQPHEAKPAAVTPAPSSEAAPSAPLAPRPEPIPRKTAASPAAPAPSQPSAPPPAAAPAAAENQLEQIIRNAWGYVTGGNVLVRIGVVILFFGVAFLLKYAADRDLLPIELRLTAVAIGGLVLLGLGWRLRTRAGGYGLVLQGGGIGVLYLTVFAAFRLYGLLPPAAAFAILVLCALLSAVIAVLQNAQALALLGVAGGFLAPVLASTGQGGHVPLFAYYLILNSGIVAIAWFKAWRPLNVVGFFFTFVIGSWWGYSFYRPAYFATTEPFLLLFWLLYTAIAVLFATRQPLRLRGYVDGTIVFGTPLFAFALQAALVADYDYGLAWSALLAGAFYLTLAAALLPRAGMRTLAEAFIAIGVVFVTLAIPLGLDARWTSAMWALEGAALVWIGVRQGRLPVRLFGALLQLGAGMSFALEMWYPSRDTVAFFNAHYLGALILSGAGLFSGYYLWRAQLRPWERFISWALFGWGTLWWFGGGLQQIVLHLPDHRWGLTVLLLGLSAGLAQWLGERLKWPPMQLLPLGLTPALALVLAASVNDVEHPFAQLGFIGWPLALAVHYLILYRLKDAKRDWPRWPHAAGLWLVTGVLTWELAWLVGTWTGEFGTWERVVWGWMPALILLVLWTQGRQLRWPLARHFDAYVNIGGWPLALYLWLWVLAGFSSRGDPWPLTYLPLLNPLDIATAFALLAILAQIRLTDVSRIPRLGSLQPGLQWLFGVTVFLWLNAMLLRTLHYWTGTPLRLAAMLDSTVAQAALTVLWSVLGVTLMLVAARRHYRRLWLTGAGLMGVVVVKLFLLDLAAQNAIERIVAFFAVGLLLLLVGYFAPVPPRAEKEAVS